MTSPGKSKAYSHSLASLADLSRQIQGHCTGALPAAMVRWNRPIARDEVPAPPNSWRMVGEGVRDISSANWLRLTAPTHLLFAWLVLRMNRVGRVGPLPSNVPAASAITLVCQAVIESRRIFGTIRYQKRGITKRKHFHSLPFPL
jgi:hypothetical protein